MLKKSPCGKHGETITSASMAVYDPEQSYSTILMAALQDAEESSAAGCYFYTQNQGGIYEYPKISKRELSDPGDQEW